MSRPRPKRRMARPKTRASLLLVLPNKSDLPVETFDQMPSSHPPHPRQGVPCTQDSLLMVMTCHYATTASTDQDNAQGRADYA